MYSMIWLKPMSDFACSSFISFCGPFMITYFRLLDYILDVVSMVSCYTRNFVQAVRQLENNH